MATCPTCKTREGVEIVETGEVHLVARPIGSFSLAGAQMKVSAQGFPVVVIRHPACGFEVRCYVADDGTGPAAYPIQQLAKDDA